MTKQEIIAEIESMREQFSAASAARNLDSIRTMMLRMKELATGLSGEDLADVDAVIKQVISSLPHEPMRGTPYPR